MASIVKRKSKYSVVYNIVDENGVKRQRWETFASQAEAKKRKAQIEYQQSTLTSSTRTDGSMPSVLRMPSIPGIKQRMSWMDFMLAPLSRRQRRNQQNRKRISSSFSNF